jgi:anaerobic ribonucleoside-triphosphate reductase
MAKKCMERTEVYSRVVGYFRPVQQWNKGKQEEFKDRREFEPDRKQETHASDTRN